MEEIKQNEFPVGTERELHDSELEIGLSWDMSGEKIDLDLTAVLLTDSGQLVDAVYFNKTKSDDEAIIHSGDEKGGQKEGIDEKISINLSKLSSSTRVIAILINSSSGQGFLKIETAELTIYSKNERLMSINCGFKGDFLTLYSSLIFKQDEQSNWKIKNISKTGNQKNFVDCIPMISESLKFMIDEFLLKEVESWNLQTGKAFDLKKGDEIHLPSCLNNIAVGLGWETQCDLDSSVMLLDEKGNLFESVNFSHKISKTNAVLHQGDNVTGQGEGDDENIVIILDKIPANIRFLICSINVYTGGKTFDDVTQAYCRLIDWESKKEFCKYKLNESGKKKACILCYLRFDVSSQKWKVKALGEFLDAFNTTFICNKIKEDNNLIEVKQPQQEEKKLDEHYQGAPANNYPIDQRQPQSTEGCCVLV